MQSFFSVAGGILGRTISSAVNTQARKQVGAKEFLSLSLSLFFFFLPSNLILLLRPRERESKRADLYFIEPNVPEPFSCLSKVAGQLNFW